MSPLNSSLAALVLNTAETAPFEAPWHAQLFATTVHLAQQNHFTWPEWAAHFGAALANANRQQGALNGGDDYFCAWLDALETFAIQRGLALASELATLRKAWEAAYLNTPHGQPVHLSAAT